MMRTVSFVVGFVAGAGVVLWAKTRVIHLRDVPPGTDIQEILSSEEVDAMLDTLPSNAEAWAARIQDFWEDVQDWDEET